MLVSVDVVGRGSHRQLKAVELTADLGPDLVDVEEAEQRSREEAAQPRKRAGGRQMRHRPERGPERQIQVQPDAEVAAVHAQARRARHPCADVTRTLSRRQALGRRELADGAGDGFGQRIIVGAEDDHALVSCRRIVSAFAGRVVFAIRGREETRKICF